MAVGIVNSDYRKQAKFRLSHVSGFMTEIIEIQAPSPTLHVLVIPGNPGIVTFYKDFVESLYEQLDGSASITAIGHISHTNKDWERGKLFSLEDQIKHKMDFINHELQNNNAPIILDWERGKLFSLEDQIKHKMDFINHELQNNNAPIILVGHSIGSHISIETYKRASQVIYCIGLYPFLALNSKSSKQTAIRKLAESRIVCSLASFIVATLGIIPRLSRFLVKRTIGNSWSATAVDAACSHLLKYHTMQNILFMAMTEFQKFTEEPDWDFLREKAGQCAFLFGIDDHWGPLTLFEEISKQVPDVSLSIEKEGHDHAFCSTEAGSTWVAQHVAGLIKKQL